MTNISINVKWIIIAVFVLSVVGISYATPIIGDTITAVRFVTSEGFNSSNVTQGVRTTDSPTFAGVNATNLTGHLNASNYNITLAQKVTSKLYEVLNSSLVTIASYVDAYSCDGSYCIYQPWYASGQVYAKNTSTGEVDYSGTSAAAVFNSAALALTPGRTWKEKIVLKGNFSWSARGNVPSYTIVELQGKITAASSLNTDIFINKNWNTSDTNIDFFGGIIEGAKAGQTDGSGIKLVNTTNSRIEGVNINNTYKDGIYLDNTQAITISESNSTYNRWNGIELLNNPNSNIIISNVLVSYNEDDGIFMNRANNVTVSNVHSRYNGDNADSGNNGLNVESAAIGDVTDISILGGVYTNSSGGNGINLVNVSAYKIIGVTASYNDGRGIRIYGSIDGTISENMVYLNKLDGIIIQNSTRGTNATNNSIRHNEVRNNLNNYGIREVDQVNYNIIENNRVTNHSLGNIVRVGANSAASQNYGSAGYNHGNRADCTIITAFGAMDSCGNTTLGLPMWWNGTFWVKADGTRP